MNTSQIILLLFAKYGPTLASLAWQIAKTENPTDEQWNALFALAEKSYEEYTKPS